LALQEKIGMTGKYLLGFGLFAAGFTSAVTAPLAAAITLKSLFGNKNPEKWNVNSLYYKLGWFIVLAAGIVFSVGNVKPIPAIVAAQAFNGFLLPVVAIFLFKTINNKSIMLQKTNSFWLNVLTILVIFITLILGLNSATKALFSVFLPESSPGNIHLIIIVGISFFVSLYEWIITFHKNKL
jgi:Mn2+/Fe2+ NRAMP family transporter